MVRCCIVCVHLLRHTDLNVTYSKNTRTGHGQVNLTFVDSVRGYYMAWYTRDLLLDWRRPMVVADSATADPGDHGHAPNVDRQYYYYKVSFFDDRCKREAWSPAAPLASLSAMRTSSLAGPSRCAIGRSSRPGTWPCARCPGSGTSSEGAARCGAAWRQRSCLFESGIGHIGHVYDM